MVYLALRRKNTKTVSAPCGFYFQHIRPHTTARESECDRARSKNHAGFGLFDSKRYHFHPHSEDTEAHLMQQRDAQLHHVQK